MDKGNQSQKSDWSDVVKRNIRREKNAYRMIYIQLYRFVLDILLFYLAWVFFRYGRLNDLPEYGFRYNYFVTIGWKVE